MVRYNPRGMHRKSEASRLSALDSTNVQASGQTAEQLSWLCQARGPGGKFDISGHPDQQYAACCLEQGRTCELHVVQPELLQIRKLESSWQPAAPPRWDGSYIRPMSKQFLA